MQWDITLGQHSSCLFCVSLPSRACYPLSPFYFPTFHCIFLVTVAGSLSVLLFSGFCWCWSPHLLYPPSLTQPTPSLTSRSDPSSFANMLAIPSVPEICVSPAPAEEPVAEPFSPFSDVHPPTPIPTIDGDSFRPLLLSPPPTVSPRFPRQLSPLRPSDAPVTGQGLERDRFEELLRASRERNAALGSGKRSPDLRKEIALKVHRSKQGKLRLWLACHCV